MPYKKMKKIQIVIQIVYHIIIYNELIKGVGRINEVNH